jgi:hypothetical protein
MALSQAGLSKPLPFDSARLDQLLDEAGIDVLLATSKHNVQYLLGGYRFFFFESMDAIGISRYLPVVVYRRGKPDQSAYVGCNMEKFEQELGKFWTPEVNLGATGGVASIEQAVAHIKKLGNGVRRVGVEMPFIPADAAAVLRQNLPNIDVADATVPLERLRVRKTPHEIALLRKASEDVVASMTAVFKQCRPGMTKEELFETQRREEVNRGLVFDYCLLTAGTSLNRATSAAWASWASPIRNCRICSALSRRCSRQRAVPSSPARGAAKSSRSAYAWSPTRRTPSTPTTWRTAWGWSATRRRVS